MWLEISTDKVILEVPKMRGLRYFWKKTTYIPELSLRNCQIQEWKRTSYSRPIFNFLKTKNRKKKNANIKISNCANSVMIILHNLSNWRLGNITNIELVNIRREYLISDYFNYEHKNSWGVKKSNPLGIEINA